MRPTHDYICKRVIDFIRQENPAAYAAAIKRPGAPIVVDAHLTDFWFRLLPKSRVLIILTTPTSPTSLVFRGTEGDPWSVQVDPTHEDMLYTKIMPALESRLVLDDLSKI